MTAEVTESSDVSHEKSPKGTKTKAGRMVGMGGSFFVSFCGSLWLNQTIADFPDIVEASLRARFVSLGVKPGEVAEQFIRGAGAGGQKINRT